MWMMTENENDIEWVKFAKRSVYEDAAPETRPAFKLIADMINAGTWGRFLEDNATMNDELGLCVDMDGIWDMLRLETDDVERKYLKKRPGGRKGGKYGIVAYGKSFTFHSRKEYEDYLMDWIAGTEGSERDRAVTALSNLRQGYRITDTDSGEMFR